MFLCRREKGQSPAFSVGTASARPACCAPLPANNPSLRGEIELEGENIAGLPPHARTRRGVAYVPQGREIFPLLTVAENLKTGFAPLKKADRSIPGRNLRTLPCPL